MMLVAQFATKCRSYPSMTLYYVFNDSMRANEILMPNFSEIPISHSDETSNANEMRKKRRILRESCIQS